MEEIGVVVDVEAMMIGVMKSKEMRTYMFDFRRRGPLSYQSLSIGSNSTAVFKNEVVFSHFQG